MEFDQFMLSLSLTQPPQQASPHLRALWWEKKGDWDRAHRITQELSDRMAACIHAYLHRREGDLGNARYWERRAEYNCPDSMSLDEEWLQLVRRALAS